jgi:glycosyltransferase involved in cell wall biosynthesis
VGDQELLDLYSRATGVFYAPFDEDYGYVTLEAMASGKPVITATDSGGTLEFVRDGENGRVVAPTPLAMAEGFNGLIRDPASAQKMGSMGRMLIEDAGMLSTGWDDVINGLLSPLARTQVDELTQVVGA